MPTGLEGCVGMDGCTAKAETPQRRGEASLSVGGLVESKTKNLFSGSTNQTVELFSLF
jgi:hypothetical protein